MIDTFYVFFKFSGLPLFSLSFLLFFGSVLHVNFFLFTVYEQIVRMLSHFTIISFAPLPLDICGEERSYDDSSSPAPSSDADSSRNSKFSKEFPVEGQLCLIRVSLIPLLYFLVFCFGLLSIRVVLVF